MPNGTLEVSIVAGRNLENMDKVMGGNDPYTIVKIGHQKVRTDVKKGTEVQWNESYRMGVTDNFYEVNVECYDKDAVTDDLIGKTTIPLRDILEKGGADAWYTIGRGGKPSGELRLVFKFQPGPFPEGFDPNGNSNEGLKTAGMVAGGLLGAAALAYGGKMAYDHFNKDKNQGEQEALNQQGGAYGQQGQQGYGQPGQQPGYGNQGHGQY